MKMTAIMFRPGGILKLFLDYGLTTFTLGVLYNLISPWISKSELKVKKPCVKLAYFQFFHIYH